jgi:hypothetical protein
LWFNVVQCERIAHHGAQCSDGFAAVGVEAPGSGWLAAGGVDASLLGLLLLPPPHAASSNSIATAPQRWIAVARSTQD